MHRDFTSPLWTVAALALTALFFAGCEAQHMQASPSQSVINRNDVSVYDFANGAALRVVSANATFADLRGDKARVLVFGDPNGKVYVNGKAVGHSGGIVSRQGVLFIPVDTVAQVRQMLSRPAPEQAIRITGRVVIDPGHGGKDPGTHSAAGVNEKSITLAVALATAQYLRQQGVEVILTRQDDTFIELMDRAAIANRTGAQVFVSIHADASKNPSAQGHSVLLPQRDSPRDARLANLISRNLVLIGSATHAVRRDDRGLVVLRHTNCPAVLVETGFLSNQVDAAWLSQPSNQVRLGWAIAEGIGQYLRSPNP
jgi:N-acetylmuramoyl-L-alanine amidase